MNCEQVILLRSGSVEVMGKSAQGQRPRSSVYSAGNLQGTSLGRSSLSGDACPDPKASS